MLKKFKYAFLNIKEEKMGYTNRTWNNRRMLPIGIVAVIPVYHQFGVSLPLWHFTLPQVTFLPVDMLLNVKALAQ